MWPSFNDDDDGDDDDDDGGDGGCDGDAEFFFCKMVEIDERVVLRKSGWLSHEKYNETKKHNNENLDNKTIETAKVKKQKRGTVKQVKHQRCQKE